MTKFEIEKGIPMPEKQKKKTGAAAKYPWEQMEVGDSFFIPNPPTQANGRFTSMYAVASKRYAPKRFEQRQENGGLRIWRVK